VVTPEIQAALITTGGAVTVGGMSLVAALVTSRRAIDAAEATRTATAAQETQFETLSDAFADTRRLLELVIERITRPDP
jgi:hypothetical protein